MSNLVETLFLKQFPTIATKSTGYKYVAAIKRIVRQVEDKDDYDNLDFFLTKVPKVVLHCYVKQ